MHHQFIVHNYVGCYEIFTSEFWGLFAHKKPFLQRDLPRHARSFLVRDLAGRVNKRKKRKEKNAVDSHINLTNGGHFTSTHLEDFVENVDVQDSGDETGPETLDFVRAWI